MWGGSFYVNCINLHPVTGAEISNYTYEFIIDKPSTWNDVSVSGLRDTTESMRILAYGSYVFCTPIDEKELGTTLYGISNNINEKIIIDNTYIAYGE